ncbi:MAG TPA: adenosylcobalamin-dependent ribonucleoside-diphosphate reductase [Thermohalobaculum sp.]|nr:adenosylcobalamin-dependent ribonucleoside-diphosphate reductase [Thermohalobaculum sp.]
MSPFAAPISEQIWDMKYRLKSPEGAPLDRSIEDTWRRVARALAAAEPKARRAAWERRFLAALEGFRFLPAGRILAGAGTGRTVTLFNCFVMGVIPDSLEGIFENLKEGALTMQQGGGVGFDFSTIRPKGAPVASIGADASGPLSFMDVWDAMCRTIMSAGSRRGAMMATMRCDHPDIEAFIDAKRDPGRLRMFNLSVLVSDAFMQAVEADGPWELQFEGRVLRTLPARDLWNRIMRATYDYAEPGVIFIDRVNRLNNLHYAEEISATNPCGEQPLPAYGACLLGSLNLAALVRRPFEDGAHIDEAELGDLAATAVRMMDNVTDLSRFALAAQAAEARAKRRIGLGVTGLADALLMTGLRYGADAAVAQTGAWLRSLRDAAYRASVELAREKGAFPLFDREKYLAGAFVRTLPEDIRASIAEHGIRNALVTSIAPTGTISLVAGNVSSGIEPVYAFAYTRRVLMPDGARTEEEVVDHAVAAFRERFGEDAPFPEHFVDAQSLGPLAHVAMQAEAQKYVDSSISKTINCPADISFEAFKDVYAEAYRRGCKGCTTYRPNAVTGAVLEARSAGAPAGKPPGDPPGEKVETLPAGEAPGHPGEVVWIAEPLERPETLAGVTYKLRWPDSPHAIYITMNDTVAGGRRRPFEIFINSKNMEHYAWTVALTRMISAVFRRGGDVSFVVEELKAVFDPRGGAWMKGRYVPSILAAIGGVIERHLIEIGFIEAEGRGLLGDPAIEAIAVGDTRTAASRPAGARRAPATCPACGSYNTAMREGCEVCLDCGHSKCE